MSNIDRARADRRAIARLLQEEYRRTGSYPEDLERALKAACVRERTAAEWTTYAVGPGGRRG